MPKYDIHVPLSGEDGNGFFIIARVRGVLRRERVPRVEIDKFTADAMSGDYEHLLQVVMKTVETS